jgi:hypothetical protein
MTTTFCTVHPHVPASAACAHCARPFCENCLADLMGQRLCAECKQKAVQGVTRRAERHALAVPALVVPLAGYFTLCLVPITSPIGFYLGYKLVREVEENPTLSGRSAGLAAMVLSAAMLVNWLLACVALLGVRLTH